MKKLISLLGVFFLSTAGYAANKIEMVTYFPVPYVAYSRVQVDKILDIGLTNVCNMSLGCTESGNAGLRPLHVQDAYLETGSLDLTRALAVRSNNVSLGANAGEANIDFNDSLRVKNLNDGYSLETSQLTVDALKLFPNRIVNNFPSCAATGADGAPQVSWQKLKIKGKEETFLVCGTPKEGEPVLDCSDRSYKLAHKSECCPTASLSDTDCWNCNNKMSIYEPAPEQERLCVLQAGPDPGEVFLQWYSSPTMGVPGIVNPSSWCNINQELGYLTLCPDKNIVENTLCTEPDGAKVCVIPNKAGYNAYNPTYSSGGYIYESQGCGIGGNSRNCMIGFKVMVCKEYSPCTGNGW